MKVYKHMRDNKTVYEDDAQDYAMKQLGIEIKPMDKHGAYTQEQIDFMSEFTEWYFSGDWYPDEEKEAM